MLGKTVHLRRLAAHESEIHREVRLRALSEASEYLGEPFAKAAVQPTYYWEQLTRSITEPGGDVMFLAEDGEEVIGAAYGLLDRGRNRGGGVRGMWVDPVWRGQGVGRALLQEVLAWARELGLNYLGLWAPVDSAAANALYMRAGFRKTGNIALLPTDASLRVVEMEVHL